MWPCTAGISPSNSWRQGNGIQQSSSKRASSSRLYCRICPTIINIEEGVWATFRARYPQQTAKFSDVPQLYSTTTLALLGNKECTFAKWELTGISEQVKWTCTSACLLVIHAQENTARTALAGRTHWVSDHHLGRHIIQARLHTETVCFIISNWTRRGYSLKPMSPTSCGLFCATDENL